MTAAPELGATPTDSELQQLVSAALEVQEISRVAEPQIQAAENDTDRSTLQQAAELQIRAAVEKHDLSIQRYQQIATAVQTDSTIREKVDNLLRSQPQA